MKQSAAPTKLPSKTSFFVSYVIIAILVLVPFHAVLSTWAGSNFGHLDLFRIWKELLLIPLGAYAVFLVAKKPPLLKTWTHSWLVWAILLYGLFFTGFALVTLSGHLVAPSAIIYSLLTNLRFLWFMLVVWAVTDTNALIRRQWAKIILLPAGGVVAFGLLQRFALPADVLRHVGYGPDTIPASATVDQKVDYRRIQSTLRGANPLGAYLIIPITTAVAFVRRKAYLWVFILAAMTVFFFTYSRSAALGIIAAIVFFVWHGLKDARLRKLLVLVGVIVMVVMATSVWTLRNNNAVQTTLFHTDETSQAGASSNSQRLQAMKSGVRDIAHQPLGAGPGTAGPASARNYGHARIAENYYLQIGQEIGFVGLGLFILINVLVVQRLWKRTDTLSRVLLASFIGITIVNLMSHAWVDDTLSLLWWGLAGAALSAPDILKRRHEQKAKTQKIATS